jgi:hypothetical protein
MMKGNPEISFAWKENIDSRLHPLSVKMVFAGIGPGAS